MEYLIAVLAAAANAVMAYAILDKNLADRTKIFHIASVSKEYESREIPRWQRIVFTVLIAILSFVATMRVVQHVHDVVGICKIMIALLCMTGAGCFDYRERRIPNIFPLIMTLSGFALLLLGVLIKQNGAVSYITSSAIAATGCALLLFLASVMTKQGIGAGDIKLICAFALLTGVYAVISMLFFAIVLCSIAAVIALVFRWKTLKGSFPFGPFLYFGVIVTIISLNF